MSPGRAPAPRSAAEAGPVPQLRSGDSAAAEALVLEDARGGLGDLLAGTTGVAHA
ncbi:hypothetical protein ACIOD2_44680 [Amycolatopsis sp. NPDC088138]|uniref:hypothetical protein n=1 Tax=Amycolatopsis sp. NPDC088138 TaxID=3363938 RepID=UPI00382086C0